MENLKALVYKGDLTPYQRALAQREFEGLIERLELFEKAVKNNAVLPHVIGSDYNERPKDRPNCPNCEKQLSPSGGALDGSEKYWTCWDCGYEVDDVPSHCL